MAPSIDNNTPDTSGAIEIAPRTWWVGSVRPDDTFQCHSYLIEAGDQSVLIDPGSALTVNETLRRAGTVVPLSSIRWVVCHHSDPDIAGGLWAVREALPSKDLQLVTEWRAETLLRHYDAGIPFFRVEEHDWRIPLDAGRQLQFVLTPYLHFPGAMCSYETSAGVLFSSDLFGGFTDGSQLIAQDESYFEAMRPFHEHYMPSREILAAGLGRITRAFDPIRLIAPQHGCLIPGPLVGPMIEQLAVLECGIFLMAQDDLDVARLLRVATVRRRITDALVMAHDLPELAVIAERVLPDILPVESLELYAHTATEGLLCFSADNGFLGAPRGEVAPPASSVTLDVPGDGPAAHIVIGLSRPVDSPGELTDMFVRLSMPLRAALNRHLAQREAEQQRLQLRESATHDALTGLFNRHAVAALARFDEPFGVLMIDIDHFKHVNDRFGHTMGDEVLRGVSGAVLAEVRAEDAVIRFGGEEILVVLGSVEQELVLAVAERIRARIAALEFAAIPGLQGVTVSIGAAVHSSGQAVDAAIAEADEHLYHAKREGRNQVRAPWLAASTTPA